MKKVVSLIMSFIMVLMLFPFNVWAAETKHGYQGDDSVLNYENTNEEIGASVEFDVKDEENFQIAEQKPTVPDNLLSEKDYIFSESCKEIKIIEIFETKDEKVILSDEETMTAAMDGTIDSGYCGAEGDGTNLIWTIDENNTLTISGEGAMADYGRVESDGWNISLWINATPWEDYNINSLVIDEGVTSIGICSFYNFSSINGNLTIPESVTSIGSYAFKHCSGFTGDLFIPDSVSTIGIGAFENCSGFDGNLVLPDGLTAIEPVCFSGCSGLTGNLDIPDGVTTIGRYAFENCYSFTGDIEIPEGITVIDEWVFANCSGFNGKVIIPNSVKEVRGGAFWYCSGLKGGVSLSEKITFLDCSAFSGSGISALNVSNNNETFCSIDGIVCSKDRKTIITCPGGKTDLIIPETVTTIGGGAFQHCYNLTGDLFIPENVTTIKGGAFAFCSGLTGDLIIPDNVTFIGSAAFNGCEGFYGKLVLPETITAIDEYTFYGCCGLKGDIIIPDGVAAISDGAFSGCGINDYYFEGNAPTIATNTFDINYDTIYYPSGNTTWEIIDGKWNGYTVIAYSDDIIASGYCGGEGDGTNLIWALDENGVLTISGEGAMADFGNDGTITTAPWGEYSDNLKALVLEDGITTIGQYAFYNCSGFEGNLIIPDSVITIGKLAFCRCSGFNGNLVISKNVTSMGISVFYGCSNLTGNLVIPENLTEIGYCAFYQCLGLSGNLVIPDSVTSIGQSAFRECSGFTGITIGENVKTIGNQAFYFCSGFTGNLVIPDSVTSIGTAAFFCCEGFNGKLVIGNGVTSIGTSAFFNCNGFTGTLIIPNSVILIGNSAFCLCSGFTGNLEIPNSVISIEESAFEECSGFSGDLLIPDSVTTLGNRAFFGCEGFNGNLEISENLINIGSSAFSYCYGFTGEIIIPYTVNTVGEFAFYKCGVNNYYFEGDAPEVASIDAEWPSFDNDDIIYYPSDNNTWNITSGKWNGYPAAPYNYESEILSGYCGGEGDGTNLEWTFVNGTLTITGKGKMANYDVPMEVDLTTVISDAPWSDFGNRITKVAFDDEVTTIGSNAFINNKNLTNINLPDSLLQICNDAFYGCENLSGELIMPDSLIKIDSLAFWGTAISSLELGENAKEIGFFAFGACLNLEAVYFNEALTKIGNWAFLYDENIKNDIVFYENLKSIGNAAFVDCNNVEAFYFKGDAPSVNAAENEQPTFNADAKLYYPFNNTTWEVVGGKWNGYSAEKWCPDAIDYGYCGGEGDGTNLTWTLTEDGILTISGEGAMADYYTNNTITTAPWGEYSDKFKTLVIEENVTSIGKSAFAYCLRLTGRLVIPNSVTTIGEAAFLYCGFTGNLVIPNNVITIGAYAFQNCDGFSGKLIIPNSVVSIGERSFAGCTGLTGNLLIPDNVTNIGKSFIYNTQISNILVSENNREYSCLDGILYSKDIKTIITCPTVKEGELIIPDGVTKIGEAAFLGCYLLTGNLIIPESVTRIEENAFSICSGFTGKVIISENVLFVHPSAFSSTNITELNVSENNKKYCSIDGIIYSKDKKTVITCPGGKKGELVLYDGVVTIGDGAFSTCNRLTGNLVIPNSVTIIGNDAFFMCQGFDKKTIIPSGVTTIGTSAFRYSGIYEYYFEGDAPSIENDVFDSSDTIYYLFDNTTWEIVDGKWNGYNAEKWYPNAIDYGYCGGEGDGSNLTWVLTEDGILTISGNGTMADYTSSGNVFDDSITTAPWGKFSSNLKSLVIEEGVTSIGEFAFKSCKNLTGNLVLPNSIISIGKYAFNYCFRFTGSLVIPNNVTTIGEYAFARCTGFSGNLVIPDSVVNIGNPFICYTKINNIIVSNYNRNYSSLDGILYSKDMKTIVACPPEKKGNLIIPNSVTTIGGYAFMGCKLLTGDLIIPNSVTSIEKSAFFECYGFTGSLIIPDSVTKIEDGAFEDCYGFTGNLVIPNSVTNIEGFTFESCSGFTGSLVIPDNVTSIGFCAFAGCSGLTGDLVIPDSLTAIGEIALDNCGINDYYFVGDAPEVFSADATFASFDYSDTIYYPSGNNTWEITNGKWNGYNAVAYTPGTMMATVKIGSGDSSKIKVEFSNEWFGSDNPSTEFNHELATTCAALSSAAYSQNNIQEALENLGFDDIKMNYNGPTKDNVDTVSYSFGKKIIKNEDGNYHLVAIVIQGTEGDEWYSNFDLQTGNAHYGFFNAEYYLKTTNTGPNLNDYIKGLDCSNTKYLITGHSRGAAVANILAADLTNMGVATKESIYAYTFATPAVSRNAKTEGFENIFNILNVEDFVTTIPLDKWGYGRYGVDCKLPNAYYLSDIYHDKFCDFLELYETVKGKEYKGYGKEGSIPVNNTINYAYKLAPTVEAFYNDEHFVSSLDPVDLSMTTSEYFENVAKVMAKDGLNLVEGALDVFKGFGGDFNTISTFLLGNFNKIISAHDYTTYYCWMATELPIFGEIKYKKAIICCPVDVYVYDDENGELVASVVNEEIEVAKLAVYVEDGKKYIEIPENRNYSIDIVAREDGEMSYYIEEINDENGYQEIDRKVCFEGIELEAGDEFNGEIERDEIATNEDYALTKNDEEIIYAIASGDINKDGSVDIKDVYIARLIAAKLMAPNETECFVGDVDGDGRITAIDANIIRKFAAKIISSLPVAQ